MGEGNEKVSGANGAECEKNMDMRSRILGGIFGIFGMLVAVFVICVMTITFLFMLVDRLLHDGVNVVCTCSRRDTVEVKNPDGTNEKKAVFFFERFRTYEYF